MIKKFKVEVAEGATRDVEEIRSFIAADKVLAAAKWVRTFGKHARSLRELPYRYEQAPDAEEIGLPLHHLIFGNYRILYVIGEAHVEIVRVIHVARTLRPEMFRRDL